MSTTELIERIKSLTPQQQREIESHIEQLAKGSASTVAVKRDSLMERMAARRERIFQRNGELPDSADMIREWRDGVE
ncbi:MAG: hypothetical protein ABI672_00050 [Vicinamibacteria bacterium]